ncbi:hypothetical protein GpartN1_g3109.t1 [Galdieria partita]|uniref:Uncharacterized protein n=1 Tax=Galdieria partita TaxID=83374 RepID=A0A9C7UPX6_9RHOD|nr:hypothetical protein GpartN1_g3109.t1 [Galdieria partita]
MRPFFVCPTVKKITAYSGNHATERLQVSVCLLSFVTRLRYVHPRLNLMKLLHCCNVFYCNDEAANDREAQYQYLEETFGLRQSFMEKKHKARKYDPRLFWESFSENEEDGKEKVRKNHVKNEEGKRLVRRKHGFTRNVKKATFTNSESAIDFGEQSKRNVSKDLTWKPEVKEEPGGKYPSPRPLTELVSLETSENVAFAYLDSPCSNLVFKTLLDVIRKVSCVKVTLILKGDESTLPAGCMSFVEMVGKENCYFDTKGCFFQEEVVSPVQNYCVMLTCNENYTSNASYSVQQVIESLHKSAWKIHLYDLRDVRQCFWNSCRKLPESLQSKEQAEISFPTSEIPRRGAFSASGRTKRIPQKEDKARIVVNHSTYIPGLIKALELLSEEPCVQTIVPGRLRNGKSRSPHLLLRVTTTTPTGFKLLARKGTTVQEVFIVTSAERQFIEELVNKVNKLAA